MLNSPLIYLYRVEQAAGFVGGVAVELGGVGDQVEACSYQLNSHFELGSGVGHAGFDTARSSWRALERGWIWSC